MTQDDNVQPTSYEILAADNPAGILKVLVAMKVCEANETITGVSKAGEGNMNLVLRVTTDRQSLIVKQARPWVEKYPEIAASDKRILSEIEFYRCISGTSAVHATMPSILAHDVQQRIMVLEDLGTASDYSSLYEANTDAAEVNSVFQQAIDWVTQLHEIDLTEEHNVGCTPLLQLNHEHIFSIPLNDPPEVDLDLVCSGLTKASRSLCSDDSVRSAMESLGEVYLKGGGPLLHGDYYPGSWLKTDFGFRVIDPEFCFCGPREYDLGVLAAHWIFCGGKADDTTIDHVCTDRSSNGSTEISRPLVFGFAGAELIRRLIGVGQLPLNADLSRRVEWLDCGVQFLRKYT